MSSQGVVETPVARWGAPAVARAEGAVAGTISTTATAAILCAILVFGLGFRIVSFHGFWGADDAEYARLANAMATGTYWEFVDENYVRNFNAPAHLPYRIALVAPLAAMFRVFGISEPVLVAFPVMISMLGVGLAFACGRHFFGNKAGLIAAALYAVVPVDVKYATQFLPDIIATFYASLAILILLVSGKSEKVGTRSLFAAGLAAGLLFGLSWLSKESVTYLVPFCAVLIVSGIRADFKRTLPLWLGVAAASGAVLLAEMSYYAIVRGDFMLRMHENERSFQQTKSYLFYEGSRFGWPVGGSQGKAVLKRLFLEGPSVFFLSIEFLLLPLFGLVATARAFLWKDAAFKIPAIWMITLIIMYNFASPTFASYTPLVLLHRYLVPILLPAAVLTAGLLDRLFSASDHAYAANDRRERMFWGGLVAAALAVVCAYGLLTSFRDLRRVRPIYDTRHVARQIGPEAVVYTDPLSRKALEFHWQYPAATKLVDFEGMGPQAIQRGSYVLVDTHRLNWLDVNVSMWLTEDYGYHEPTFSKAPPEPWKVLWRNPYATLYRVD